MSYPNIQFMIQGWFLIIVINSLDTDQVLRNVRLDQTDLDLNCLKLGEPCIYHKGWLIITFISRFVGPGCARSHVLYIFYSVSRYLKDIALAMKTRLYAERRRPTSHCALTSQQTHLSLETILVWSGNTVVWLVEP